MLSRDGRAMVASVVAVGLALTLLGVTRSSFAGRPRVFPHKLVLVFTGDDQGQIKQTCG